MTKYRPLAQMAMVLSLLFLVFLAIEPFTGLGQAPAEPPNIIGNRIFCDNNLDGQLSGGEFIPNVDVTVAHWSSPFISTTTTDAGGNYLFTGLPVDPSVSNTVTDAYTVTVDIATLPANCNVPAVDPDTVLDNMSIVVFDANRTDNRDMDFGYKAPPGIQPGDSDIGNRVYCDADLSGDSSNPNHSERIPGVTVSIENISGDTDSMVTDASGNYLFENIAAGTYTVTVDISTLPSACNIPFLDGDSTILSTGTTSSAVNLDNQSVITLTPGQDDYNQDFGYEPTALLAVVGDKIWCDDDGDNTQDAGEGIFGVDITITENVTATMPVVYNATTNATGRYEFINLAAGDYTVAVDPATLPASCNTPFGLGDPDGVADNQTSFTLTNGQINRNIDLGYQGVLPISDIGGQLWCETTLNGTFDIGETVLVGVPITLTDSSGISTTLPTDVSGNYLFANLAADTYTVAVDASVLPTTCNAPSVDPDATFDDQTSITLVAAVDQLAVNFAYEAPPTPTPVPTDTPTPLPTDTPTPLPTPLPTNTPLPGTTNTPVPTATNTQVPATNTPIPAITNTPASTPMATATTAPAAATMVATAVATTASTAAPTTAPTTAPATGPTASPTGSIGGSMWCDNDGNNAKDAGEELAGIAITLIDSNEMPTSIPTDTDGTYLFDSLAAGNYVLMVGEGSLPSTCNYIINSADNDPGGTAVALGTGESITDVDYIYITTATMADVIFEDTNVNGSQDAGEAGLANVTVTLSDLAGNTAYQGITDADGTYSIDGIVPGQYRMLITLPAGWEISNQGATNLNTTIDPTTGQTSIFNVTPGSTLLSFTLGTAPVENGEDAPTGSLYLPVVEKQ